MTTPRMKSLETCASATGSAFGFEEGDFEVRFVRRKRRGKVFAMGLALCTGAALVAHYFGWTALLASITGWRAAA